MEESKGNIVTFAAAKTMFCSIIKRNPWCSETFLSKLFEESTLKKLLHVFKNDLRVVTDSGLIKYYSLNKNDDGLLLGIKRREICRIYAVRNFGYEIIYDEDEMSPCGNADLFAKDKIRDIGYRLWGDIGQISPECLFVSQIPPVSDGSIYDIIITNNDSRASVINTYIEMNSRKGRNIRVVNQKNSHSYTSYMKESFDMEAPSGLEKIPSRLHVRSNNNDIINIQRCGTSRVPAFGLKLSPNDIDFLCFIGNNPFLTIEEAAIVYSGLSISQNDIQSVIKENTGIVECVNTLKNLQDNHLITSGNNDKYKNRYILSWEAIDLICGYFAAPLFLLQKHLSWPLKYLEGQERKDNKNTILSKRKYPYWNLHCKYSENWAISTFDHQKLCREFSLGIVMGIRSAAYFEGSKISSNLIATVSMPLSILKSDVVDKIIRIRPDAHCSITNQNGKETHLFIEIERNRNSIQTVIEKIEKYGEIIPVMNGAYDDAAIVFVFEGSKGRRYFSEKKFQKLAAAAAKQNVTFYIADISDFPQKSISKCKYGKIETNSCGNIDYLSPCWTLIKNGQIIKNQNLVI